MWGLRYQNCTGYQLLFKEILMQLLVPCVLARDFLHRGLSMFVVAVVVLVLIWLVFCACFSYGKLGVYHLDWEGKILLTFFLFSPLFTLQLYSTGHKEEDIICFGLHMEFWIEFTNIWLSNFWEHNYSGIEIFIIISWDFFNLPYILISCSPRNISKNIFWCKSVPSFPTFLLPLFILLHIFFLSLFSPHSVHSENTELTLSYNISAPSPMSVLFLSKLICPATWSLWNLAIIQYIKHGS